MRGVPADCAPVECVSHQECNIVGTTHVSLYNVFTRKTGAIAALRKVSHLQIRPKTSLCGNRRSKNVGNLHKPTRRLPCREVRGDEGGLEGEETPPKGVSSPSKVYPYSPIPSQLSLPKKRWRVEKSKSVPCASACRDRGQRTSATPWTQSEPTLPLLRRRETFSSPPTPSRCPRRKCR